MSLSAVMHKDKDENGILASQQHHQHPHHHNHDGYASSRLRELEAIEHSMLEGDMFLQVSNKTTTASPSAGSQSNYEYVCMCAYRVWSCDRKSY